MWMSGVVLLPQGGDLLCLRGRKVVAAQSKKGLKAHREQTLRRLKKRERMLSIDEIPKNAKT